MDSYPDVQDYESSAKRIKIDFGDNNIGELCNGDGFSCFSASSTVPIDSTEAITTLTDCDSGYEASNLESLATPSHSNHTSPHTDSEDMSNFTYSPTPTYDNTDTSQGVEDDDDDDDDDNASTVSHISNLSGLSNLSGQDWKPMAGSMIWIQQQMSKGTNPRTILSELGVEEDQIPQYIDDVTLWKIIINMLAEPPKRHKLRHVNTLDDVVRLLKGAKRIIVLTGAGVSVSCGIPDFRSRDGIYSRLAVEFPNLPNPQAMFDINYFGEDPRPFFKFAKDIYPGKFKPSPCHRFIKLLERQKKLLRNYTQNIDTLEKEAGIERVIECHGSFATATCTKCDYKVGADRIREVVLGQKIPLCEVCHRDSELAISTEFGSNGTEYKDLVCSGIMKPDIVFFGEGLPDTFHEAMTADKTECDLLLVIGSSLKVRPVALIPSSLPSQVPQILINREPLPHCHFDVELLGDCDVIINHLCRLMGEDWQGGVWSPQELKETRELPMPSRASTSVFDVSMWRDESASSCTATEDNNVIQGSSDVEEVQHQCSCSEANVISSSPGSSRSDMGTSCTCRIKGKNSKERHMSIDSARDSGIGENSNFTDLETDSSCTSFQKKSDTPYWHQQQQQQQQARKIQSLAERLPPDTFHRMRPSRYIFPGAEVFYDALDDDSAGSDTMSDCC